MSDYLSLLSAMIKTTGPVASFRTSSAKARGAAKNYPYYGTAEYALVLRKSDGAVIARAVSAATSARRSIRLALQDTTAAADAAGGVELQTIGVLSETDARDVIQQLAARGVQS